MEAALLKPKTGRPPKFAPDAAAVVVIYVRKGCPRRIAANAAGIGRSTLMRWMARGKAERKGKFRDFWDDLKKAEAEAVADAIGHINAAAERGTWQAAAWWLERRYPDEFGSNRRVVRELQNLLNEVLASKKDRGEDGIRPSRSRLQ